jgi:peptidyl-prolyl cis-trans isomerase D
MLKQLREKTKTILWIVVVAFVVSIFAVWGMNLRSPSTRLTEEDAVGSVNGVAITRVDYSNAFSEILEQLRQQRGQDFELSPMERRMLSEQAWELAIQKILMSHEMAKLDITVSDAELVDFLRRNPHPTLQQVFQTEDGQFDYQMYLEKLSDPEVDWTDLERWGRTILPELKFQSYLSSQVHVSDLEARDRYRLENTQVAAAYVEIPFEFEEPPYDPSESELDSLYRAVRDDYTEPESRRVALIEIEKKPTSEDEREVLDRLLDIREELLAGRDFAEMAEDNSEDLMSAQKGGDLGFFTRSTMVEEFDSAAFSLSVGEISMPVRTEYGYHLIKVEERKTENGEEKIHARHILMKVEPGYDTIDSLSTLVRDLTEEIKSKGFEKAASAYGLAIKQTEPFTDGYFIEGLGFVPRVISFAFNRNTDEVSSPIEEEKAVYFVKIVEKIDERTRSLDDVRMQLVDEIRRTRSEERARTRAESIRQQAVTGGSLESAALSAGLEMKTTPSFKKMDTVPGIGGNTAFATACYFLPEGELSPPVKGRNSVYLIRVIERRAPDMDIFVERRGELITEIRREKIMRFLSSWYDEIRQRADIVDMREQVLN